MNEIVLALLGFGLGILATVLTQVISRRFRLNDARQRRKVENLQRVRSWMEAYRDLFRCKYPDLFELVFAHKKPSAPDSIFDKTAPARVHKALMDYQTAKTRYEQARESGSEALWTADLKELSRTVAPHLKELGELEYNLFVKFPDRTYRIDWDRVSHIQPSEVFNIIHTRLQEPIASQDDRQREIDLADARENCGMYRQQAEYALKQILNEIGRFESQWIALETQG